VTVISIASMDRWTLVCNIVVVDNIAKFYRLTIGLATVNVKNKRNESTIHQLKEVLSGIQTFDRTTINAWEEQIRQCR
jgi:hypothetical protein